MKTRNILLAAFAALLLVPAASASAGACEDKCKKDWPRDYVHAVPRKACQAKCWALDTKAVQAAKAVVHKVVDTSKKVAGVVTDTAKKAVETGKKVVKAAVDTGKKVVKTVVDTGKKVVKTVVDTGKKWVNAAGRLAKGVYDKVKNCISNGFGGCLKKIAKSALELGCKGVGVFWDAAKQCCNKKGAVQCLKDAGKELVKRGAKWLCQKVVPNISKAAAWLLNKAGSALKNYSISLRGSEIGALACAFKKQIGHTIADMSKKFGDPVLSIKNITIGGAAADGDLTAPLGATATVSVPGLPGAFSVRLEGEVGVDVDTSCDFKNPLAQIGARVTKVGIGSIPQWLTDKAVKNFVNPSLGCFTFCPPQIKAAGMDIKLNYCKVVDTCLKSKCTAPVLNTIISQIFPVSLALAPLLPNKPALENVRKEIHGWSVSIGGVKFRTNPKDPYKPSISASVAIGPPGRPKFNVNATGTLAIQTTCRDSGESMVKVTPSLALRLGDVPKWMGEITLPNVANNYINEALTKPGGPPGRLVIKYPSFLSGEESPPKPESVGPGIIDRIKQNWQGIKSVVRTALAGKFMGDRQACDEVARPAAAKAAGGACVLCLKSQPAVSSVAGTPPSSGTGLAQMGHVTGSKVNFRAGPGTNHKVLGVLSRCTEFRFLQRNIAGVERHWAKIQVGKKVGYIAEAYVQRGPSFCEGGAAR